MKDTYENVDEFISDVFPLEFRKILHRESAPEPPRSDSAAYNFEEKLVEIIGEER